MRIGRSLATNSSTYGSLWCTSFSFLHLVCLRLSFLPFFDNKKLFMMATEDAERTFSTGQVPNYNLASEDDATDLGKELWLFGLDVPNTRISQARL